MLAEIMNYTQVADARIIEVFEKNTFIPAKAITLFSHVLNAQHIWANRIVQRAPLYSVWEEHLPMAFASISKHNFELFAFIFENVDLTTEITYSNSSGFTFTNVVQDILFHAFNHSTYHRGQIASLLKANAIHPPVTDYIMIKREMQL